MLAQLDEAMSNRTYFESWPKLMAGQMDRREVLAAKAAERGVAVPDHEDYDTWRNVTDFAVGRCEGLMDDPVNYGIHLDYIALRAALGRVRDVLEDDDRHLAATLAGQREGESLRMHEERVARLLGVAPTACRAQGRTAAEQGPALEHANLTLNDTVSRRRIRSGRRSAGTVRIESDPRVAHAYQQASPHIDRWPATHTESRDNNGPGGWCPAGWGDLADALEQSTCTRI